MRKLGLFGIAIVVMLAGIAAWAGSSHSAVSNWILSDRPVIADGECKKICPVKNRSI
jgi:hypothetical protein